MPHAYAYNPIVTPQTLSNPPHCELISMFDIKGPTFSYYQDMNYSPFNKHDGYREITFDIMSYMLHVYEYRGTELKGLTPQKHVYTLSYCSK